MFLGGSTTMSSLTCSTPSPCLNQRHRRRLSKSHSSYFSSDSVVKINHQHPISGNQESYQLHISFKFSPRFNAIQAKGKSDDPIPEDPVPPAKRSFPEWKKWMVGIALSMILPSYRYRHKWGPLILLRNKVDETIETAEMMTEIAEDVGEAADKLIEAVENKIPEQNIKLKEAVETIDHLSKEVVKEAKEAKRLIHKVEKAEKKLEIIAGVESKEKEEEEEDDDGDER